MLPVPFHLHLNKTHKHSSAYRSCFGGIIERLNLAFWKYYRRRPRTVIHIPKRQDPPSPITVTTTITTTTTDTMPSVYENVSRRESWPPTQVHINPFTAAKDEPRPLLEDIDDDPLTYFLTPAPGFEDDDIETSIMDFDAGIEDTSHPREIVRSVSPSSLTGNSKSKSSPHYRPATPEFDSDVPTTDDEDEEEDYITAENLRLITLSELAIDGPRLRRANKRPRSPLSGGRPNPLPSRASFPQPSQRGRGSLRPGAPYRNFSSPTLMRARPNRLWREPSPDVWSIEEETEEEMMSEMGGSIMSIMSDAGPGNEVLTLRDLVRSGKMVKKVRFVLPE